ncbi:MAG: aldehyde dehydrogenase family protein, partial [Trebonia sp.]
MTNSSILDRVSAPGGTPVKDPATGETIGHVMFDSAEAVGPAVKRAKAAQPAWAALGDAERCAVLLRAAEAVEANAEELARLLSREQGKPLNGPNARFEVQACADWIKATAAIPFPSETIFDDGTTHAELTYRPIGVVGAVTPWNWPMMIAVWQLAASLRMGNTVVQKPSEYTALSGLALATVLNEVLPQGVLTVVTGDGAVGEAIVCNPAVGKVMFTGSTATGKRVVAASAQNISRLTLELGGNDAGIVLPDVDPKAIAEGLFWGAFINTGQTCAAMKRLYVHDSVYDDIVTALANVAAVMPMGVG